MSQLYIILFKKYYIILIFCIICIFLWYIYYLLQRVKKEEFSMREMYRPYIRNIRLSSNNLWNKTTNSMYLLFRKYSFL
jgi:hypothetical protein